MIPWFNSLAPGRCGRNFKFIIFKSIPWTDISCAAWKIVVRWIPQNSIDYKSTLVQVMAWCRQATSHCLNRCWPRSMSPYGVTRPQCVYLWLIHLNDHVCFVKLSYNSVRYRCLPSLPSHNNTDQSWPGRFLYFHYLLYAWSSFSNKD